MKRKGMALLLSCVLLFSLAPSAQAISWPGVSANSAVVMDGDSGRICFEKDADTKSLIASTTKIMTALVVLEQKDPEETVEILPEYTGIEGSSFYLQSGETLTVRELLYGLLLESGNDAAVALACYTAGSIEAFAELMNEKAASLGAVNTCFENPHGLDGENQYSTARDLALIMRAAMENDTFAEIAATKEIQTAGRSLRNHNKLLWQYDGVCGGKTGYTMAAGRILVSACKRDGLYAICVTMGDPDDWTDHENLYDSFFARFDRVETLKAGSTVCRVPVVSGESEDVSLITDSCRITASSEDAISVRWFTPKLLYAPVQKGQIIGRVEVLLSENVVSVQPLVAGETVRLRKEKTPTLLERFRCYVISGRP